MHPSRVEREHRFTSTIESIVTRGGHALIPVFALGRAQVCIILTKWGSFTFAHLVQTASLQYSLLRFISFFLIIFSFHFLPYSLRFLPSHFTSFLLTSLLPLLTSYFHRNYYLFWTNTGNLTLHFTTFLYTTLRKWLRKHSSKNKDNNNNKYYTNILIILLLLLLLYISGYIKPLSTLWTFTYELN